MESLFFHPRTVHMPLALGVLMPLIAGGIALAWWRRWLPARTWVIAVLLQAVLLGAGLVALQTGEQEEEPVERIVPERHIEDHEHAAERFLWASSAVLGVMLLALVTARRRPGLPLAAAAVLGTFVALGFGYRAGESGGALVYQHGAANAYAQPGDRPAPASGSHPEHEDDD